MMARAKRIVGIDLGTTHTVVAHCLTEGDGEPQLFAIPQLVAQGQVAERSLLSSSLYAPLAAEAPDEAWRLGAWIAGELARIRGGEVASRWISSAKSWLCNPAVDRRAAILPWRLSDEAPDDEEVPRVSPVDASGMLLRHVERAWRAAFPDAPLADQEVVLTVPASFDAVARELTVEAARAAGLQVRLLEEPQAAFYDFMRRGGDEALAQALPDDDEGGLVLVCDVGGGTTDLSLIRVSRKDNEVAVDRVAVGRHLLLGGDNMDLALAHLCERRLAPEGERLPTRKFAQLMAACRGAKEKLLGADAPEDVPITLLGSGSKLIGGALKTRLTAAEAHQVALEGFFPNVGLGERSAAPARAGIVAFGLPYEREVAITRHVAAFVRRHTTEAERPTALLLNGGVFHAPLIVERLSQTIGSWRPGEVAQLAVGDPDTAVALGAVAYGLAVRGRQQRIGGGAGRGYYLGLGSDGDEPQAICVLPRGAEDGTLHRASEPVLELTVGRPVRFDLFASSGASDAVGTVVALDEEQHERLPPLVTTLHEGKGPGDGEGGGATRRVVLEAQLSAVGTLDLSCVDAAETSEAAGRFALAFDLRQTEAVADPNKQSAAARHGKRLEQAAQAIERIYGKGRKDVPQRDVKGLIRSLEKIFGKRTTWDAALSRALFDMVIRFHKGRRRTPDHERVFWMLAGFCLRPGAGHPRDGERAARLFKLFEQRLVHGKETRSWPQFWIAWRRIAAGLDDEQQARLRDVLDPFLAPSEKRLKKPKAFRNEAQSEMLELAASLERVDGKRRRELGSWVLERTWTERDPRLWAALGRIGARVPTYGSAHQVVPARAVDRWMDHLLRERWEESPSAPRAAVAMCRVTGDRARDVADDTRKRVAKRLEKLGVAEALRRPVLERVAIDDTDRADFFGEDLPVGLRLAEE
ncbi:MAG: hsp70 family protein [Deltaproteobacteria bacterium]|nr:hsp70 family protein [Deltaproteobacteria bacterium]